MNAITFTQKILAVLVLALCFFCSSKTFSETLEIDSTFTSDSEFFPFDKVDFITGITIDGSLELFHDTSMVRILLVD